MHLYPPKNNFAHLNGGLKAPPYKNLKFYHKFSYKVLIFSN